MKTETLRHSNMVHTPEYPAFTTRPRHSIYDEDAMQFDAPKDTVLSRALVIEEHGHLAFKMRHPVMASIGCLFTEIQSD